jgi:hypothetical protein
MAMGLGHQNLVEAFRATGNLKLTVGAIALELAGRPAPGIPAVKAIQREFSVPRIVARIIRVRAIVIRGDAFGSLDGTLRIQNAAPVDETEGGAEFEVSAETSRQIIAQPHEDSIR